MSYKKSVPSAFLATGLWALVALAGCKEPSGGRTPVNGKGAVGRPQDQSSDARVEEASNAGDETDPSPTTPSPGLPEEEDSPDTATSQPTSGSFEDFLESEGVEGPGKFVPGFRSSPDFFTNMDSMVEGLSPHGWVRIWYSRNLEASINRPTFTAPVGSVAIQRFQNAESSGYVVMIKKPKGFDEENGDWHYEVRDERGELLQEPAPGKIATCSGCHGAASAKDYLSGTELGFDPEDFDQEAAPGAEGGVPTKGGTDGGKGAGDPDPIAADPNAPKGPGAFRTDFGKTKDFFTTMPAPVFGNSPHGKVRVWYSSNVQDMINNAKLVAPVGTVAIKEFDNDGRPGVDGVAVMIKQEPGYDPRFHDWRYEMRDAWGVLLQDPKPGKISACAGCHAAAQATDFLAATKLDETSGTGAQGPGKFKADYYESAEFFTRMATMGKEEGPHGATRIWYSTNARPVLGQDKTSVPDGTVAVARYKNGADLGVVVMIKDQGSDPANGDWRYEMRDRYGNLLWNPRPGIIPECVNCHKQAASTDYFKGTALEN